MKGFFYTKEENKLELKTRKTRIKPMLNPCENCGLYKKVNSPKLGITGEGRLNILVLGESQGFSEDESGIQFVGDAGQVLRNSLDRLGYDLDRDFYKLNAVRCRPTSENGKANRTPTDKEILYCRQGTWKLIRELNPKSIFLMGLVPLQQYLLDKGQEKPKMGKWRGWNIPDKELRSWIFPMYHPSYVNRNSKDEALANLFDRDLDIAIQKALRPFPKLKEPTVHILSEEEAIAFLNKVYREKSPFVNDFETTGLKPHRPGHEIAYMGMAINRKEGYACRFTKRIGEALIKVVTDPTIKKRGHNIKFEDLWTFEKLGTKVLGWDYDGMIGTHVLDDRPGICSLEFQTAIRYGDWSFKNDTDPYLKPPSDKKSANDFNRIFDCPPEKILKRTGLDAAYEFGLCEDQIKEIDSVPNLRDAYDLFHDGVLALADIEQTGGIVCDVDYFKDESDKLDIEIAKCEEIIYKHPLHTKYKLKTGNNINPAANPQLIKMFYDIGGYKPTKETKKQNISIDNEVISQLIKVPEISELSKNILLYRKYEKLKNTYIGGFLREEIDGVVRPFFNLHTTRSYRSSSDRPNFQNIPARDEESKRIIRSGLYPHKGHKLIEIDFGGMEVRISACYNKDPELIKYIYDPTSDMHRDQALDLFFLTPDQITKQLRYEAKSNFVFAEFYGSYWDLCAKGLWTNIKELSLSDGTPIFTWLKKNGIKNLDDYKEHVKQVEKRLWNKFNVFHNWRERWIRQYIRTGEVPMFHGFRRQGLLQRNEIINTSIQGTAFHCLLWSLIKLNDISKEEKWVSKILGQIHDSIVISIFPEEQDHIIKVAKQVMTEDIRTAHKWLIVPLEIEVEATEIDQPWSTKKEIEI